MHFMVMLLVVYLLDQVDILDLEQGIEQMFEEGPMTGKACQSIADKVESKRNSTDGCQQVNEVLVSRLESRKGWRHSEIDCHQYIIVVQLCASVF